MLAQHRLLTVGETALILRQSQRSVRDKIARGEIPALRVGVGPRAPIRIEADELEQWLTGLSSPKRAAGGAASIAESPQPVKNEDHHVSPLARVCRHGEVVLRGARLVLVARTRSSGAPAAVAARRHAGTVARIERSEPLP